MTDPLTASIKAFATDPEIVQEHLALLKVGHEKGDSAEVIMQHLLVSVLLRFYKIPLNPGQS